MDTVRKICIIGSGTMGSGIALLMVQSGFNVIMKDISLDALKKGMYEIEKRLMAAVAKGKITEVEKDAALSRITYTIDIKEALQDADFVIEAATENMTVKKAIFKELDELTEDRIILATNTSSLSVTEIAASTKHPERVVGIHFFNPVQVMKLVEVIKGAWTLDEVANASKQLVEKTGKTAIDVKEAPGFAVNRMLVPMINEAVYLLMEGVCSKEDIDAAMKLGANHPMGPLELGDLIGLDVCLHIMETLYREFSDSKYRPCPLLVKMARGGFLGKKSGRGFYTY